jgi:acid stress-induced BolA-like protein IbaG/YrbA
MLDDTDNYIKDNLQNILDGKFDDKFDKEQLKMMLEMSFLYNHINVENDSVIFEYNGVKLKINGISEIPTQFAKETITSSIKNDVVFKSALTQFLRDKKINEILE